MTPDDYERIREGNRSLVSYHIRTGWNNYRWVTQNYGFDARVEIQRLEKRQTEIEIRITQKLN